MPHDAKIFFINRAGNLEPMSETGYATEQMLQTFIAKCPDLLPGDQINPENPRRWLLVKREMAVPGEVEEGGRMRLDHLLLDQDGTPTFIECKRASDARVRREVVAQMLDYAANGTEYWSGDLIRQCAAETAQRDGHDLDTAIRALLGVATQQAEEVEPGDDADDAVESYWTNVKEKLASGTVRMIFVADEIPKELRRLVEFLNEKMAGSGVEVLAVEVRQFVGAEGRTVLVPRVIGRQERMFGRSLARRPAPGATDRDGFVRDSGDDPSVLRLLALIEALAMDDRISIRWGGKGFAVRVQAEDGTEASVIHLFPDGRLRVLRESLALPAREFGALVAELRRLGIATDNPKFMSVAVTPQNVENAEAAIRAVLQRIAPRDQPPAPPGA